MIFERVYELLAGFKRRKPMYIQPVSVPTAEAYLHGLMSGVSACGFDVSTDVWWRAVKLRGWKQRALGPEWEMRKRGMNDDAVIDEFIEIAIATFKIAETQLSVSQGEGEHE